MQILKLQLYTTDLSRQLEFYTQVFNLPVLHASGEKIEIKVGKSQLTFLHAPSPLPGVYHFALNIPENQFTEAVEWLRKRVPLIADKTGKDTFYSTDWDAHNAYFYDPDGNIGELIARHTLPSASQHSFSGQSLLAISEIGIAVEDVPAQASAFVLRGQTAIYREAGNTFIPVGDELGLFVLVKRGRIWAPDTGKPAEPLPLLVTTQAGTAAISWQFP